MKKIRLEEIQSSHGTTNWSAVEKQSDADIEKLAKASDARLLSDAELSQFRRDNTEQGTQKGRS